MNMHFKISRALAELVLRNAAAFRWELQGFGMLRCYLPGDMRLQVWNVGFAVPGVTSIHDHPWHFDSLVVAGEVHNERFSEVAVPQGSWATHRRRSIVPGVGLRRVGEGEDTLVRLVSRGIEFYLAGATYHQQADEIHESRPLPGTVTLIARKRVGEDVARSYYPAGCEWVSAEPREATPDERDAVVGHALQRWFAQPLPEPEGDQVQRAAFELLEAAEAAGKVVTIEQVPRRPLAMGNYKSVVSVRPVVDRPWLRSARAEWESAAAARFIEAAGVTADTAAGLATACADHQAAHQGPDANTWESPSDAVDEELSYWTDDGE